MQTSKGCAFLMDMGTGKTITTIAVAGAMFYQRKVLKLLVVAPKSIVDVWDEEFQKFASFPYSLAVLDGSSARKADTIRNMIGTGLQVIVVNYESCWRLETELTQWKPDMIVCDESSKIKNPQAKCSKALHHLGKISSYNLILTGTPVTNSPLDFFSQYKFLDDSIFGQSFYSFRSYYAIMGGYQQHQIIGYKHLAELVSKAHAIAYTDNFTDCVLKAVNLGYDTDTTAAVAGSIAGAYYGVEGIPTEWLNCLARKEWIADLIEKFEKSLPHNDG